MRQWKAGSSTWVHDARHPGREARMKCFKFVSALVSILALQWGAAIAAEFGSAKEARAMLDKTVAAMKKDKAAATAKINKGDAAFKDRDLYPFCATMDGNTTVHPTHVGTNLKDLKDKKGKAFGAEMFTAAEEG